MIASGPEAPTVALAGWSDVDVSGDPFLAEFKGARVQLQSDLQGGLRELERLAHCGSLLSILAVADAVRDGRGYDRDLQSAEEWYGVAVGAGSHRALVGLAGTHLLMGRYADAILELEAAIATNYPPAYDMLAGINFRGSGVPVDRKRARDLWRKGASLGHLPAKWNLIHYSVRGYFGLKGVAWALVAIWPLAVEFTKAKREDPYADRIRPSFSA